MVNVCIGIKLNYPMITFWIIVIHLQVPLIYQYVQVMKNGLTLYTGRCQTLSISVSILHLTQSHVNSFANLFHRTLSPTVIFH